MPGFMELALFAGPNSQTWDWEAYQKARDMEGKGANPDEIRAATGMFRGQDGKWRVEIDDSAAQFKGESGKLSDLMDHEKAYQAYPQLTNMPAQRTRPGFWENQNASGQYGPNGIEVNAAYAGDGRTTTLHEMQHAISQIEGFPRGTFATSQDDPRWVNSPGEQEAMDVADRASLLPQERPKVRPRMMRR